MRKNSNFHPEVNDDEQESQQRSDLFPFLIKSHKSRRFFALFPPPLLGSEKSITFFT